MLHSSADRHHLSLKYCSLHLGISFSFLSDLNSECDTRIMCSLNRKIKFESFLSFVNHSEIFCELPN